VDAKKNVVRVPLVGAGTVSQGLGQGCSIRAGPAGAWRLYWTLAQAYHYQSGQTDGWGITAHPCSHCLRSVGSHMTMVSTCLLAFLQLPHRAEAKYHAARCVVVPASDGTGCIAGGSIRSVLELAGVKNCLAKRIGSRSALNR
jgi:ribosomal protein S5